MTSKDNPYLGAGVDTSQADNLVDWLQSHDKSFSSPFGFGKVLAGIGGFAGLFSLNIEKMKKPTLVASTDGIGTKLLLGLQNNQIAHLGHDLVAMCVNDLYTVGAVPLFFLDYFATGRLNSSQFKTILQSIRAACATCKMGLLGGETAEMPGLYATGHFDLAGFVVGIVDEDRRLGAHLTMAGDKVVALKSSGFHSNGFSLIRSWLANRPRPDLTEKLMTPTKLYHAVPELLRRQSQSCHAIANITGGGISGNLPRVIAEGLTAQIDFARLPTETWMTDFIHSNDLTPRDVEDVFNLGVGMMAIVDARACDAFCNDASELGLEPHIVGEICSHRGPATVSFV